MENWYYSKKLDRSFSKRLDVLIYAHDGRGLGHASRGIAIGIAIRRLFPKCKTLFVSGCKQTNALRGPAPLDWIKLPSYETTIIEGKVEGSDGDSNFYKSVLGELRTEMLASMVKIFKPRIALVDHAPSGRREELHRALEETKDTDTLWENIITLFCGMATQMSSAMIISIRLNAISVYNPWKQDMSRGSGKSDT
jgi:predicted glycosyltransferase